MSGQRGHCPGLGPPGLGPPPGLGAVPGLGAGLGVEPGVGAPDGRVASGLIFGRSPVDGRAARAEEFGLTFERNTALQAAGYDDTAHSFTFGGR